jgi:methyltransferase (TIGR00027 family)
MILSVGRKAFSGGLLFVLVALFATRVNGVDPGKTSQTAEATCAFRAIGATDPDPRTRNPDHMAKHFLNPAMAGRFPGLGLDYEAARIAMDQMKSGAFYYVNARTLHMDALLAKALKGGFRQVVILGAGFDSRAYRFHKAFPQVRFFEIDLPATSTDKQSRVEKLFGQRPGWVRFVPIDFNSQSLAEVLAGANFQTGQRTFYIWEGVTYFISREGVDSTLRFIARHSAPGSEVVFDYMHADVPLGLDYTTYGARRVASFVAFQGEPYVFGIDPRQLETFVNLRGLDVASDLGPHELTERYLIRSDGTVSGKVSGFLRIVHASVPEKSRQRQLMQSAESRKKHLTVTQAGDLETHRVPVPQDVQAFLTAYSDAIVRREFEAVRDFFSPDYLSGGIYNREQVLGIIRRVYQHRPVHHHEVILTRFDLAGDRARVDGYVQRRGYRTPLMVTHMIKAADGRWRWYRFEPEE